MLGKICDLYSDYMIVNTGQHTAVSLSDVLDNSYSHDQITRCLSKKASGPAELWSYVKPTVLSLTQDGKKGVLILDDTIEAKPYTQACSLISWHYDHTVGKSVKGVNQLTALFYCGGTSLPVGYELIEKDIWYCDVESKREKRESSTCKNTYYRQLVRQAVDNKIAIEYVLSDKWFSSAENMQFIDKQGLKFIFPIKSNRKVALSESDKAAGKYQSIESVVIEENQTLTLYLEQLEFPLQFSKQVFKDGDEQKGVLYLVTNDSGADASLMKAQYALRWKVEEFYKSIKSNIGYAKAPVHTNNTLKNHFFLTNIAFVKLELVSIKLNKNHFALKAKLIAKANKNAWNEWAAIKQKCFNSNIAA